MRLIAWLGLIITIVSVLFQLKGTFTEKEVSGRIANFIGMLMYSSLVYFFIMYLFN